MDTSNFGQLAYVQLIRLAERYIENFEAYRITNSSSSVDDVTGSLYELAKKALENTEKVFVVER